MAIADRSFAAAKAPPQSLGKPRHQAQTPRGKNSRGDPSKEWLTPEEAFQLLGGNPDNPNSKVSTLDGKRRIGLSAFRRLVNTAEYADFGFQYSSDRHLKNLPYLRRLPRQP